MFKSKLLLLTTLFVSSTFLSCTDDEEHIVSPLVGEYELIEYKSQAEIDLNGDGIKGKDLLLELEELYFNDNYDKNNILGHELNISDYYNIRMYAMLPGMQSLDDVPYSGTYGSRWLRYELKINDDLVTISDFERIPDEIIYYSSELEKITLIEPNIVQLEVSQSFIDYSDNESKRIKTIATFKKIQIDH
ncbi:hypothetical protein ML462_15435 [Gramella lutea]|uniref:Uncharacterized protein n=1 Tax=Christiangramia lutea TaxID=1607951 RepID=A0A9X1V5C8_9FLAO|nr:hypothetical protein [Christiangramia lutea]MCH4824565.1 hypothetical protein [Christiangramia lutea]